LDKITAQRQIHVSQAFGLAALLVALLILWRGSGHSNNPEPGPYNIPVAGVGQWADFGTGTGTNEPIIKNGAFTFPTQASGSSVNYVYTKPAIAMARGQTFTLNYSVDGNATFGVADSKDVSPAAIRLFIWEAGDDLSGSGAYAYYRWWCSSRINLTFGDDQTFSCVIDDAKWTSVFGESGTNSTASRAGFAQAVKNAAYVGVTFGGQMFAGHGVWTTSGNATFTINGISISERTNGHRS
jgi:hypothetical protein